MERGSNRRRRIVVNKELQSHIVLAVSWPAATCLALTAVLLGVFCMRVTQQAIDAEVVLDGVVPLFVTALGFLVAATAFFLLNCVKISHRVAGPMYALTKTMNAVRNGDPSARSHLRQGDLLEQLGRDMNDFLDWVEPHLPRPEPAESAASESAVSESGDDAEPGESVAAVASAPATAAEPEPTREG